MNAAATLSAPVRPALFWQPANLDALNRRFESADPRDALRWGLTLYGDDIALATGFGPSGVVLLHMVSRMRPQTTIFYLHTGLLFAETLALRDQLAARLGVRFTAVHPPLTVAQQAQQHGDALWERDANACCAARKVDPLRRFLRDRRAWISGIRRDQSATRRQTPVVHWDHAHQLVKLNPLATWTRSDVWRYIIEHDLPYNALHDQGYPSVGCAPCTRPAGAAADERAGRWAGSAKTECGIHVGALTTESAGSAL